MWMMRRIKAGQVEEKYSFYSPATLRPRGRRKQKCTARKQDVNEHSAEKRLARILNCNFRHNDALLRLSYEPETLPKDRDQAEADLSAFLRRMKYQLGKTGKKLDAYVCITSDMDGKTGEVVRIHHHLVVKAEAVRLEDGKLWAGNADLEALWGKGSINLRALYDQPDLTPMAEYLMRQVRRVPDKAKYKAARGMKKPEIVDEEEITNTRELKAPKGARLQYRREYEPGKPQYIRYVREDRHEKRGGRRE